MALIVLECIPFLLALTVLALAARSHICRQRSWSRHVANEALVLSAADEVVEQAYREHLREGGRAWGPRQDSPEGFFSLRRRSNFLF